MKYKYKMTACAAFISIPLLALAGCSGSPSSEAVSYESEAKQTQKEENVTSNESVTESENPTTKILQEEAQEKTLMLSIDDTALDVVWEENESVLALQEIAKDMPLEIEMSMYGDFEQVGSIGRTLPSADAQMTTEAGDIVLYSENRIVVFYDSNSWSYTKLGHIEGKTKDELRQLLGSNDVTLKLEMK